MPLMNSYRAFEVFNLEYELLIIFNLRFVGLLHISDSF